MSDLACTDHLEYTRLLVSIAREADDSDPISIRKARAKIEAVKAANPQFKDLSL